MRLAEVLKISKTGEKEPAEMEVIFSAGAHRAGSSEIFAAQIPAPAGMGISEVVTPSGVSC